MLTFPGSATEFLGADAAWSVECDNSSFCVDQVTGNPPSGSIMSHVTPDQFHDQGQALSNGQDLEDDVAGPRDQSTVRVLGEAQDREKPFIHRSASDVNIMTGADQVWDHQASEAVGLKRVLSEITLSHSDAAVPGGAPPKLVEDTPRGSPRRSTNRLTKHPKFTVSQYAVTEPTVENTTAEPSQADVENDERGIGPKSKSSRPLSTMARRRSWILGSRSPSPSNRKVAAAKQQLERNKNEDKKGDLNGLPEKLQQVAMTPERPRPLKRQSTFGSARSKRPLSALLGKSKSLALENPDLPPIPKSMSTDRLSAFDTVRDLPAFQLPLGQSGSKQMGWTPLARKMNCGTSFEILIPSTPNSRPNRER